MTGVNENTVKRGQPSAVTVVVEHWGDNVSIALQNVSALNLSAVTAVEVEGATFSQTFDLTSDYPVAQGTVNDATILEVVVGFSDGTSVTLAEVDVS
jgi:hypothetical protein